MGSEAQHVSWLADVATPSRERDSNPEVWRPREFYQQLALPDRVAYDHLPHEIHLDEQWHALIRGLVDNTVRTNRECSVAFSCLDERGPVLSLPFEMDLFFQGQWGEPGNPLFISHVGVGSETKAEVCAVPAAIRWNTKVVPMRRVGLLHTHPDGLPFSDGDMGWLTVPNTPKTFIAAATKSETYFLMRTDAEPPDAHQYLREQRGAFSWREQIQFQLQPKRTILKRNQAFAQYCNFGLYYGRSDGPLLRLA